VFPEAGPLGFKSISATLLGKQGWFEKRKKEVGG